MKIKFKVKKSTIGVIVIVLLNALAFGQTYKIVDTGQEICYDSIQPIAPPLQGESFYGQDAQISGNQPAYQDNGDGTVTDMVTGLMWQQNLLNEKLTFDEAVAAADTFSLAGYNDWRLPAIKELYSLILFSGTDPSGPNPINPIPFIDTGYFEFEYGDTLSGVRLIDAQYWSSTEYVGTTMNNDPTTFGVNFADGRIKGYPSQPVGPPGNQFTMTSFVRYVRGEMDYCENDFTDNGNGTITDEATSLVWDINDSGEGLNWEEALAWVDQKNQENYLGYSDWRLPNAKEMQSILDYSRAPQVTGSAAIDPVFNITSIIDEGGNINYPFFWSGITHTSSNGSGEFAVYIAFGEALGWMEMPPNSGNYFLVDVHGAGAQRSDPKSGDPANWPYGNGPQGDVVRIDNYVRCVRVGNEIRLGLKVFLEGPFNGTDMNTGLIGNLPLDQPYNAAPWNYTGIESVISIPDPEVVDWVLIELRDTTEAAFATSATIIAQQAAFVKKNGNAVSSDGETELRFSVNFSYDLYLVVWHRNHLGVMSSNPLTESEGIYTYDFTSGQDQAYGGISGHKEIATGVWGMVGCDGDANSEINIIDKTDVWMIQAGLSGYFEADFNMDGNVNNSDKNESWLPNNGFGGQVPEGGYKCQVPD